MGIMISRAADGDEIDSREYKRHGHYFHRCEAVESEAHADNRCHNWLDIVVHSDKCRAQILLSYHSAYIGYEGGEYDHIAYSGKFGVTAIAAKVNIHFISVNTEYFFMKFL